jgi:hypoxanthine phosphoribosyltransferase
MKKTTQARLKTSKDLWVLVRRERLQRRISKMAKEIARDFAGEPVHLVGVLKGAMLFVADLARRIPGQVTIDFISVSSYGTKSRSTGQVKLTKDLDASIEGQNVLLVEDILDSGRTLQYLLRVLEQRRPKRLRVAVLLDKFDRRKVAVQADYVGFRIPDEFVVGYGLDYAERYRNLPDVCVLRHAHGTKKSKTRK